jgi:integrase
MASIEQRGDSWLVRWRVNGKRVSRSFPWGQEVLEEFDIGEPITITKEMARTHAEAFRDEVKKQERAARRPLERVQRELAAVDPSYRPVFSTSDQDYIGVGEDAQRFENYLARLIDGGAITDSAKATYRHTLKNHIRGTPLGLKNLRFIDADDVEAFWDALRCGDGARRNIAQVLRKGFSRALKRRLIDTNPMLQSDIEVPSKKLRVRGPIEVLELDELKRLAEAAASDRDRLIVKVMGFAGLRAGEVAGLRRRDIVQRDGYCELRLRQQVVRVARVKKVTALKTDAALRDVPVPCQLADELVAFAAHSPSTEEGCIFRGRDGTPMAAQGINNSVQRAAKNAGLGKVNSHLLRHTAASLWFADGMDAESVRSALGHADIQTTLGLYAHMMKGGKARLAASMERRMNGGGRER